MASDMDGAQRGQQSIERNSITVLRVNLVAVLASTSTVVAPFLVGSVAVQLRSDLGLRISQVGILSAIFFGCAAAASVPAGRLIETLGATRGLQIACVMSASCLLVIAGAPSVLFIQMALVPAGLAYALVHPSANLFIAQRTISARQGLTYGIKQAGVPAATLAGGVAIPTLALTFGWRSTFLAAALLATGVALAVPRSPGHKTLRRKRTVGKPTSKQSTLVVLTVGTALTAAAATSMAAYLVASTVSMGFSQNAAGILLATGSLAGIATRIGVGWAADKVSGGRLSWVAIMMFGGAAGYLGIATGNEFLLIPGALLGFIGGWGWPGLFNFIVVLENAEAPAAATGITQSGVYAGGILGPLIFGFVAETVSYGVAWLLMGVLTLMGAAMVMLGRALTRRDERARVAP